MPGSIVTEVLISITEDETLQQNFEKSGVTLLLRDSLPHPLRSE